MHTKNLEKQLQEWRHDFHTCPELNFDLEVTSPKVEKLLNDFGYEVHSGIGKTGMVGILKNGSSKKSIGIRADMDALPVEEVNEFEYRSQHPGKMHACGHDGLSLIHI